jgi:hypothetical protein
MFVGIPFYVREQLQLIVPLEMEMVSLLEQILKNKWVIHVLSVANQQLNALLRINRVKKGSFGDVLDGQKEKVVMLRLFGLVNESAIRTRNRCTTSNNRGKMWK